MVSGGTRRDAAATGHSPEGHADPGLGRGLLSAASRTTLSLWWRTKSSGSREWSGYTVAPDRSLTPAAVSCECDWNRRGTFGTLAMLLSR